MSTMILVTERKTKPTSTKRLAAQLSGLKQHTQDNYKEQEDHPTADSRGRDSTFGIAASGFHQLVINPGCGTDSDQKSNKSITH